MWSFWTRFSKVSETNPNNYCQWTAQTDLLAPLLIVCPLPAVCVVCRCCFARRPKNGEVLDGHNTSPKLDPTGDCHRSRTLDPHAPPLHVIVEVRRSREGRSSVPKTDAFSGSSLILGVLNFSSTSESSRNKWALLTREGNWFPSPAQTRGITAPIDLGHGKS